MTKSTPTSCVSICINYYYLRFGLRFNSRDVKVSRNFHNDRQDAATLFLLLFSWLSSEGRHYYNDVKTDGIMWNA